MNNNVNEFLTECHDFKANDEVIVHERYSPKIKYTGKIYSISRKPVNKYLNPFIVDYFYITFPTVAYHKILKRGWEVICDGNIQIIGDIIRNKDSNHIEQIFIQHQTINKEVKIHLSDINAILIWRTAFEINKKRGT